MNKEDKSNWKKYYWIINIAICLIIIITGESEDVNDIAFLQIVIAAVIYICITIHIRIEEKKYVKTSNDDYDKRSNIAIKNNRRFGYPGFTPTNLDTLAKGVSKGLLLNAKNFVNRIPCDEIHNFRQITRATQRAVDNYAIDKGMKEYNFVSITRTTMTDLKPGYYMFNFNEENDIELIRAPFEFKKCRNISSFLMAYDASYESEKKYIIKKNKIRDFQYFGTEVNTVETISSDYKPSVIGTMFSELFLGTTYTLLTGLNKANIKTENSIKDLRVVQLILKNQEDIEFKGISIYYEFNRRMGNVKNKEKEKTAKNVEIQSSSYIEELKSLKELLDIGVITEQEFNEKKKEILNNSSLS